MMRSLPGLLLVSVIVMATGSSPLTGQVAEGDILLAVNEGMTGFVLRVNPVSGAATTLVPRVVGWSPRWLRMAPDNQRIVAGYVNPWVGPMTTAIVSITAGGPFVPYVALQNAGLEEFALDHDDRWILVGAIPGGEGALAVEETSRRVTTLFRWSIGVETPDGLCIDRDPGAPPYVITAISTTPPLTTNVLRADRRGVISTLHHASWAATAIALEPATGDYLLGAWWSASGFLRLGKNGGITSISAAVSSPTALRFDADGSFWTTGHTSARVLAKLDGAGRTIRLHSLAGLPTSTFPLCIEIYGARKLVCNGSGKPGTTVDIRLRSGRAGDANRSYALACSLARRPGLRLGNGECLDLSVTDPLFQVTAANRLPGVFQSFRGVTDHAGSARAKIVLPAGLPASSGITVFVSGIIYDSTGVRTVTNSHWFVLS